jgi:hypothetical protein
MYGSACAERFSPRDVMAGMAENAEGVGQPHDRAGMDRK